MIFSRKILCKSLDINYDTGETRKKEIVNCIVRRSHKTINFHIHGADTCIFINEEQLKNIFKNNKYEKTTCLYLDYSKEEMEISKYNIVINAELQVVVLTLIGTQIFLEFDKKALKEVLNINTEEKVC